MTPPIRPVRPRRPQRKSRSALFVDRHIGMLRKAEKQGSERQGQKMDENFPAMLQCGAQRGARNPGIAWRIVPGCGKPIRDQTRARSTCQNSTETASPCSEPTCQMPCAGHPWKWVEARRHWGCTFSIALGPLNIAGKVPVNMTDALADTRLETRWELRSSSFNNFRPFNFTVSRTMGNFTTLLLAFLVLSFGAQAQTDFSVTTTSNYAWNQTEWSLTTTKFVPGQYQSRMSLANG
jgi:hypothetical protein